MSDFLRPEAKAQLLRWRETLTGIVAQRSGLDGATARRIVRLVHAAQETTQAPALASIRTAIMIARIAAYARRTGDIPDAALATAAADVFAGRGAAITLEEVAGLLART